MPTLARFFGLIIRMYTYDNREHHKPHIHIASGEFTAVLSIPEGNTLEGRLPANKRKLVKTWIEIHQEELMDAWGRAIAGEQPGTIDPLR